MFTYNLCKFFLSVHLRFASPVLFFFDIPTLFLPIYALIGILVQRTLGGFGYEKFD